MAALIQMAGDESPKEVQLSQQDQEDFDGTYSCGKVSENWWRVQKEAGKYGEKEIPYHRYVQPNADNWTGVEGEGQNVNFT